MVVIYKNHVIEYFGGPIAISDNWRGKVRISWDENGTRKVVPVDSPSTGFSFTAGGGGVGITIWKKMD